MTKKEMEMELRRCLSILRSGSIEEVRAAKKEIYSLLHKNREIFRSAAPVLFEYLPMFDSIEKPKNQADFSSGISLFFLVLGDKYFEVLKDFTLKVIQHPNGLVREAIRNTAEWLYVSLTSRVFPFTYPKGKNLTEEQKIMQSQAQIQYINLVKEVEVLIERYDTGQETAVYIEDMKPSVSKSLQFFWSRLTESRAYPEILEQFRQIPDSILRKRAEIEKELLIMLKKTRSSYDLEDIKNAIYRENGPKSLTGIVEMFDTGKSGFELNDILKTLNEAWNYFPHKILEGLSPAEKLMEYQQTQQKPYRA